MHALEQKIEEEMVMSAQLPTKFLSRMSWRREEDRAGREDLVLHGL